MENNFQGRYAAALFSAANKSGALDAVEKDLKTISATMDTDPRLGSFLLDPSIKKWACRMLIHTNYSKFKNS